MVERSRQDLDGVAARSLRPGELRVAVMHIGAWAAPITERLAQAAMRSSCPDAAQGR